MTAEPVKASDSKSLKVCLVTGEFIGPRPCGGIGTATTGLAELLAADGHDVTVLYTRGYLLSKKSIAHWQSIYARKGVHLEPLSTAHIGAIKGPLADLTYAVPPAVLNWLASRAFDLVHVNDTEADGYLAIAARRTGAAFAHTAFALGLHSPRAWIEDLNKETLAHPLGIAMDAAERFSIASADIVWSPSRYLVEWITTRGFKTPDNVVIQQYALPETKSAAGVQNLPNGEQGARVIRIVFFGRLEERKGLFTFLDAIDALADELTKRKVEVVFLGSNTLICGVPSARLIQERAANWRFAHRRIDRLAQPDALAFLSEPGSLAVIASPADNSPCTIYEVTRNAIPFIASRSGGIPELIAADQAHDVLFAPTVDGLTAALTAALARTPPVPRPAITVENIARQWHGHHDIASGWNTATRLRTAAAGHRPGFVALVQDFGDAAALTLTLTSLRSLAPAPRAIAVVAAGGRLPSNHQGVDLIGSSAVFAWLTSHAIGAQLLAVHGGVEVQPTEFETARGNLVESGLDAFAASTACDGQRIDAPPPSAAIALALGPLPTGVAIFSAGAVQRLADGDPISNPDGIVGGLIDHAHIVGIAFTPYPASVGSLPASVVRRLRPALSPQRIAAYSSIPAPQNHAIVALAAIQGLRGSPLSKRFVLHRVLATPLHRFVPSWIARAERIAAWRRR